MNGGNAWPLIHGQPLAMDAVYLGDEFTGLCLRQTTQAKFSDALLGVGCRQLFDEFAQALTHFTRGFTREGDGQNVPRGGTFQPSAKHAGHQHPRFTSACTSLNHDASVWVASHLIKGCCTYRFLIFVISRLGHASSTSVAQWSFRQMPLASQKSHTWPSPNAGKAWPW
jgi:hypothetical protein